MLQTLVSIALAVFFIASGWIVFAKAGDPGWAILVPFYNAYVMIRIAGLPWWCFLLLFVPLANVIVAVIVPFGIAKHFGKGVGFGFGLLFLGFIFYPILAFGSAQYSA